MIFPFSIFVLILHAPTRLTELGNTALSCQSHHNNSAPWEIFWMENGATAALDSFFFFFLFLFLSFGTYSWTLLPEFTPLCFSSSSDINSVSASEHWCKSISKLMSPVLPLKPRGSSDSLIKQSIVANWVWERTDLGLLPSSHHVYHWNLGQVT